MTDGSVRSMDDVRGTILGKLREKRERDNKRNTDLISRGKKTRRERFEGGLETIQSLSNLSIRDALRVIQIIYMLTRSVVLWVWDWVIYPIRFLSKGRLLIGVYDGVERPMFARRLRMAFQDLGSTFIKLGQIISMMFMLPWS